ncbi:MAG TPA: hypothetical protein VJN70_01615 [Gemmatimonadaceae bacterium]|nr:hypothetical protein [Gemmatimonadaceae bacterium]
MSTVILDARLAMRTFVQRHKQLLFSFLLATVVLAIAAVPLRLTRVSAQQPAPSQAEQMRQMQEMMGPMMRANMEAMMNAVLAVLAQRETADKMASFSKNYLDALVIRGFSREEALRLVAAHAPSIAPGMR